MVITNVNQVVYQGDGVTTAFPFTFKIQDASEINLQLVYADGTVKEITNDFYVDTVTSTVHYPGYAPGAEPPEADRPAPVQTGQKLTVWRDVPMTQEANLMDKWPFKEIENGLDKLTMIAQQIYSGTNRKLDAALASMFQLAGIVTDSDKLQHITDQYNAIDTKSFRASLAAEEAEISASSASISASNAASNLDDVNATAEALINFLNTKETLTAPAVDTTLTISGAAADAKVAGEIEDNVIDYNIFDVLYKNAVDDASRRSNGIDYTWNKSNSTVVATGTATSTSFFNLINSTNSLPKGFEAGKKYWFEFTSSAPGLRIRFYQYLSDGTSSFISIDNSQRITLKDNCIGIIIRFNVINGVTVNNAIATVRMLTIPYSLDTNSDLYLSIKYGGNRLDENDDANDYNYPGSWVVNSNELAATINNLPFATSGRLIFITSYSFSEEAASLRKGYQIYFGRNNRIAYRFYDGAFNTDWIPIQYAVPLELNASGILLSEGDDINNLKTGGSWYINSKMLAQTILNLPVVTTGKLIYLVTYAQSNDDAMKRGMQIYFTAVNEIFYRSWTGIGWSGWKKVGEGSGGGSSVTVNNTYNINTSPTITTDTNRWLAAVDDENTDEATATDMTGAIMSMLTDTGYCHLGEGTFYVSGNIDLPSHSLIEGCGNKTIVKLLDSVSAGYVFKLGSYSKIQNLQILGSRIMPSFTTEKGTRHAIYFTGNYDGKEDDTVYQVGPAHLNNVYIKWFSGSAVYCHNTSINYLRGLYATDCLFERCWCGIDIDYYSEFHKYVNCTTAHCYIGCINGGGNNGFINCIFHAQYIGFLMDNSSGDKPNNAHGYMTGCTFCHIGSNAGSAITIKNIISNGFIFSTCQVHYNSIDITDSYGIVFSNFEFGRGTTGKGAVINVTNGGLVAFNGCVFINDINRPPQITITNNDNVHFNYCYGGASGNLIEP